MGSYRSPATPLGYDPTGVAHPCELRHVALAWHGCATGGLGRGCSPALVKQAKRARIQALRRNERVRMYAPVLDLLRRASPRCPCCASDRLPNLALLCASVVAPANRCARTAAVRKHRQRRSLCVDVLVIGVPDGRRRVQMRSSDTVGQLLDALRPLFDVPLADRTLRHAHGGAAWERAQLANPKLTLSMCGVRDGALLTVCADVRGGMEADDDDEVPPPTRVCCGLATEGGTLNVAAHVLLALARHQRAPDTTLLTGAQSSTIFEAASALEDAMQAPGVAPTVTRGDAFDAAASAVLGGAELRREGDLRGLTWALLQACGAEGACHRVELPKPRKRRDFGVRCDCFVQRGCEAPHLPLTCRYHR